MDLTIEGINELVRRAGKLPIRDVRTADIILEMSAVLRRLGNPWTPIEYGAPKDGTAILGYGRHTVSPADAQRGVMPGDHWWEIMVFDIWRPQEKGGQRWVFAKDGKPTWSDPTHWMPLPKPPEIAW